MRNFWGFYDNGMYRVGCSGGTVFIYDQNNHELAKFSDMKYVYVGMFQPGTNIFVAKSTEGSLAIYDLNALKLVKLVQITRIGAQDEGFTFTPDGSFFYNIEKPVRSTRTQLTKYRTSDYEVCDILFSANTGMCLDRIEFDANDEAAYVLGFMRNASGIFDYGFIGMLIHKDLKNIRKLTQSQYDYLWAYKSWEASGFTKKKLECSRLLKDRSEITRVSLKEVYEKL